MTNIKPIDTIVASSAAATTPAKRNTSRIYTATIEYSLISNLVAQQYIQGKEILFDKLLAIPVTERIPGLMERYGQKTVHRMLLMILREFAFTIPLPRYKKMSDTKLNVLACELMLTAAEDQLSVEDVIVFLSRARAGVYGSIQSMTTTTSITNLLEQYRQARHEAYLKMKAEQEAHLKAVGPTERLAAEPTAIRDLFNQGVVVNMNKRMSG